MFFKTNKHKKKTNCVGTVNTIPNIITITKMLVNSELMKNINSNFVMLN